MDQIWLASPSPAMRLWPGSQGATWRLNAAARTLARRREYTETSWQAVADALGAALRRGPAREGRLEGSAIHWRALPMNTGWLVWLLPDPHEAPAFDEAASASMFAGLGDAVEDAGALPAPGQISAQFAEALRLAEVCVWRIDLKRRRVYFSDGARALWGLEPDPAGLPLAAMRALLLPEDVPALVRASEAALRSHAVVDVETLCPMRPGMAPRRMLTRRVAERDAQGRAIGLLGVALDQTERIAERERAQALARGIDFVADTAGVGVWTLDLENGRGEWNRQMFLIHGLPPGTAIGGFDRYVAERIHPEDRDAFGLVRQRALVGDDFRFDSELRILRPDGTVRWVEFRSRRDVRDGRAVMVGIMLDATQRIAQRHLVDRALREKGALERADVERSDFLARMSHELRTPLNAVLGFAQLIEHDAATAPMSTQLERVALIRSAGEQLLGQIGDVLEHLKRDRLQRGSGPPAEATAFDAVEPELPQPRGLSVLYIEDNPINVLLVEELVGMRANTLLRCEVDGTTGVAAAAAMRPDVVLVDMQLPDIDGFEVMRRLRANRALDGTAVIALSANGMSEDIALALEAGFDNYWTKPIDFRRFLEGLDTLAGTADCSRRRREADC